MSGSKFAVVSRKNSAIECRKIQILKLSRDFRKSRVNLAQSRTTEMAAEAGEEGREGGMDGEGR
ncbi:MAG: hypothetical protein HC865_22745 [Cyanobacteria bacterium RU_5_0]|nr:hypothetical protein [Cyanobacteria bacterium RU_5_0]